MNKTNLDLNWIIALNSEGFDFATGDTNKIFSMLGYTGKRSTNMVEKIIAWTGASKETSKYVYTTNDDGFPVSITESYNYGTNEQPNWAKDKIYRITYNK